MPDGRKIQKLGEEIEWHQGVQSQAVTLDNTLSKWLAQQVRQPSMFKFPVTDITEVTTPDGLIIDYLALALLLAHGNPQQIRDQYNLLLEDAEDNSLNIMKMYLESRILPSKERISVRVGNFGEILASRYLIEFEGFWFPIYKLRYREKKDWAMRLTDLFLIKQVGRANPLVCYGEVKTISGDRDKDIAIKGHDSLVLGEAKDFLAVPEILDFISTILYETNKFDEALFISKIALGKIEYNKRYDLFIIHTSEKWNDEVLNRLEGHPLDERLTDFSTKVVLISQLRKLIDTVFDRCATVTKAMIESMNKQDYLQNTYLSLESLIRDRQFRIDLAQVQARSIQEELSSVQPDIKYTFKSMEVWRKCDYIFSNSSILLRDGNQIQEDADKRKTILDSLKIAAQSFEFLSKFANEEEREILLINSAICYHIAGYHANAQCLAKMVERMYLSEERGEETPNQPDTELTWFFRLALISFLRRDIVKLQQVTQQAISFVQALQEKIVSDAEEDQIVSEIENLYGHLFFQKALSNFTEYCKHGALDQFRVAQRSVEKSCSYFERTGDIRLGVITSELRTLLKLFEGRSTWSNIQKHGGELIQSPIWVSYLRNLALENSVVEFWPSQLKSLQSDLLTSDDSFVVQMPTSAGKTFIAELAILATLTNSLQKRCLYLAPYRALVNEVEDRLAGTLGALGYRVSNLAGGFEFDSFQNFLAVESHVLVTTPEKADLLFRTHPEYFENIATIVIDEGHILDEGIPTKEEVDKGGTLADALAQNGTLGRGVSLEMLITRLKKKLTQAHFLFLSAVMPEVNADDFVTWLSKNSQRPLKIEKTERPSRQTIVAFRWEEVSSQEKGGFNGELRYHNPDGTVTFVPYFLQRKRYFTGEVTPTGLSQTKTWPGVNNKAQLTAMLAAKFAKTGPVLIFCAMHSDVKKVVDNIITSLKYLEASDEIPSSDLKYRANPDLESYDLAKEWLGEDHSLTRGLHYGVGLHYGPLPDPVRQAVEDDFRIGKISILVSTNTLGQGVNLPVKTAIIYSLERRYQDPYNEGKMKEIPVKKRDFWNICGRAGRAGKETEGQIVFVTNSKTDARLFREFRDENNIEVVESPLYKLLTALTERRITQGDLVEYLDPHVLALLAEEVVDTEDEGAIRDFLQGSLVGVQAKRSNISLAPLISAVKRTSTRINQEVTDPALRVVFASTGLRVNSCQKLEEAVDLFLSVRGWVMPEVKMNELNLDEELLEFAFEACQNIPEMKLARGIKARELEDELRLVKDWIGCKPIREIRSIYWIADQEDKFGEYIADRLIYKMPWGFNGFLRILAHKLHKNYDEMPLTWQYLPSMMKYGVNSVFACWISSFGVSSRELAFELAQCYPNSNDNSFVTFLKWLINLPFEFLFQELPIGSVAEKKRLVQKINKVIADDTHLQFILQRQTVFESSVQGIPYGDRVSIAFVVREGDKLVLQPEPENQYDPSAICVLFEGKQIGYVRRDTAKFISREMQVGREFRAIVKTVKPPVLNYPYPHIEITIIG